MDDITPALLEALRKRFEENLGGSRRAAALLKAIQAGGVGYAEAERYAEEVGRALSGAFGAVLTADVLPDGRMYWNIADRVVRPLLEQDHKLVADAAVQVQTALNRAAGLGIKAQRAPMDTDRINGLLNKLCAAQDYDSVRWVLGEPVINYSMAVADETLRLNVDWQGKAGLEPKVRRIAAWKCCEWCSRLAGTYDYPVDDDSVYKRHLNCRCKLLFVESGKGKVLWEKNDDAQKRALEKRRQERIEKHEKEWQLQNADSRDKIEARKQIGLHPSATGKNEFKNGFSEKNLEKHFDKHSDEYVNRLKGFTKETYNETALELVQSAVSEDIVGYRTENGAVVRYQISTNDFVKGYPNRGIATMFKPKDGYKYYMRQLKKEGILDD